MLYEVITVYTETLLDLMTRAPDPQGRGKLLIIGGAIANFTDVAKTFTGCHACYVALLAICIGDRMMCVKLPGLTGNTLRDHARVIIDKYVITSYSIHYTKLYDMYEIR